MNKKFFVVGETEPRLAGTRYFTEAATEQEAREKFYQRFPSARRRPEWLVKVREITEKEFMEMRVA